MDRIRLWALLSFLLAPVTILACHKAWTLLAGGAPPMGPWQRRLVYLGALAALKTQHTLFGKLRWEQRSRALGCGPPTLYPHKDPILGLDWFFETLGALRACTFAELSVRRFAEVGRTHYNIGVGSWALVTDEPENVKAILATSFDDWEIAGPRLWSAMPLLGPRSVFTANGAVWQHARAMIRPSFVRDQVADLARFDAHVVNLIAAIRRECDNGRATIDLQALLAKMTMDSSTDFMLGKSTDLLLRASPEAAEFLAAFDYSLLISTQRARLGPAMQRLPSRKFDAALAKCRAYVRSYVADALEVRKKTKGRGAGDKISRAEAGGDGGHAEKKSYIFLDELVDSGADQEYILGQVLSIILAGRDTTAASMSAMFYLLARCPAAVRKVQQEIRDLDVKSPTWEQLRGMKYLQNVIRETLRLYPAVAANSRTTNKDTILPCGGGPDGKQPLLVPKGTSCRYWIYSMQRRKDIYGEDADEFRPERWETLRVGWEYTPFSGGPRICIGQQFALTQMAYTLFRILQSFESIEPRDSRPVRLQITTTISFADGCLVGMKPMPASA